MREVRSFDKLVSDLRPEHPDFLMRALQELVEQPQLVHDLQGRRMDRIAAEIPQEIGMLFENQNRDPGSGKKEAEHHTRRSAARDAAADRNLGIHHESPAYLTRSTAPDPAGSGPMERAADIRWEEAMGSGPTGMISAFPAALSPLPRRNRGRPRGLHRPLWPGLEQHTRSGSA